MDTSDIVSMVFGLIIVCLSIGVIIYASGGDGMWYALIVDSNIIAVQWFDSEPMIGYFRINTFLDMDADISIAVVDVVIRSMLPDRD